MLGRVKLMCWILYAISLENVILDYLRLRCYVTDNPYVPVGSYVHSLSNAFHANPGRAEAFVVRSDANL